MQDHYSLIGETAGKVYQSLAKGPKAISTVQKETGCKDSDVFNQALGWLAREGKLGFDKKGKSDKICLVG